MRKNTEPKTVAILERERERERERVYLLENGKKRNYADCVSGHGCGITHFGEYYD